jgi:hypothetical protein
MNQIVTAIITTACTVAVSLLVTFIFNKVAGLPKKIADEKKAQNTRVTDLENKVDTNHNDLTAKIDSNQQELMDKFEEFKNDFVSRLETVEDVTSHYPEYRQQSLRIQGQLQEADINILAVCNTIKDDVIANRQMLDERLLSLERREKNALREKIIGLYRTFTDETLNPRQAWTDMEHHSFFELVRDYESLGGNDYVHKVILPAMNRLEIIYMDNLDAVKELYESRNPRRYTNCTQN